MATATLARTDSALAKAPPRVFGPVAIALVLVLGGIMATLDMTIVNVAINQLALDFGAPLSTIQWVTTGYSLALGAVIPMTAWAVGRFGARRLYMLAIGMFVFGSMLAGFAWSAESLIFFRVLQGLGGGMIMPVGMTVLIRATKPEQMGRMMSILGLTILVGPAAGPVLGGWLVDEISWRWMFFINLPLGALVIPLAARVFPADETERGKPLDVLGLLMLSPGLALFIYGVTAGGEQGSFSSAGVLLPLLAGLALVAGFVVRALTARHPLLELRLYGNRAFATAAGTLGLFSLAYFGSMILLPLYYQMVRGESATMAGLLGAPLAVASGITMQFSGRLVDRVSPGLVIPIGVGIASLGFFSFASLVAADTPYWMLVAAVIVMGIGVGATMMPTMTAATRNLSHDQAPFASTMLTLSNPIFGSIGTAVFSVLLTGAMSSRAPAAEGGIGAVHALPGAERDAIAPALADAFQHTYAWVVGLMALAVIPALLIPRSRAKS